MSKGVITTIKEDEISPYVVCKGRIIRPFDGTTFTVGQKVTVVYLSKYDASFPVGESNAPEYNTVEKTNQPSGIHYEGWADTLVRTTSTTGNGGDRVYSQMTPAERATQIKNRTNELYHGYGQKANQKYAEIHKKPLKLFPALAQDPEYAANPNIAYINEVNRQYDAVNQFADFVEQQGLSGLLGCSMSDLRKVNQEQKNKFDTAIVANHPKQQKNIEKKTEPNKGRFEFEPTDLI